MKPDGFAPDQRNPARFATTRWSVVLACDASEGRTGAARAALADLCQSYWRPIFAFICHRGYAFTDAQDLTQDFFVRLLEGPLLARADPERGKFRTLLLKALTNFLSDVKEKRSARKRGGDVQFVSWDDWMAEAPSHLSIPETALASWPAERVYDLRWAATVVERALRRLAEECEQQGRGRLFDHLSGSLMAERADVSMAELMQRTGLAESPLRNLLHEMRERYRALLREEVADTVESPESINEEVRYLCATLALQTG